MKTRLQAAAELLQAGRLADARTKLLKELRLAPKSDAALQLLGAIASEMGRHDEAVGYLRQAASLARSLPGPHLNLGAALLAARRYDEAESTLQDAVSRWPDIPEGRLSYGNALLALGKREQATEEYRATLRLNPAQPRTCANLALALYGVKDHKAAAEACERLLKLDRNSAIGWFLLTMSRQTLCNWELYNDRLAKLVELVRQGESVLGVAFASLQLSDNSRLHRRCADLEVRFHVARTKLPPPAKLSARNEERIRIAYVSADFRAHPTTALIAGLIEDHDRSRFEVIGVSLGEDDRSSDRQRAMSVFDSFLDVRGDPIDAVVERMRKMEVDIAVDLMSLYRALPTWYLLPARRACSGELPGLSRHVGHRRDRLPHRRPVHRRWRSAAHRHREARRPARLLPMQRRQADGSGNPAPRASCGLPEAALVFCSFNHAQKLTPQVFDLWMRILREVEGSVLWLMSPGSTAEGNLRDEAERRGVAPSG